MIDEFGDDGSNKDDDFSKKISPQLYDMRVSKGTIDGLNINLWDKVRECIGTECALYTKCPYFLTDNKKALAESGAPLGNCRVEQKYLHQIFKPFFELIRKVPDEFVVQTIGMHLVPLYHDLVQLKMLKASLKSIAYTDSKGTIRIHPVIDQLEKTHKTIMTVWRQSNLQKVAEAVGFMSPPKVGFSGNPAVDGDPDTYDAMASGG